MEVVNKSKNTLLARDVKLANTFIKRLVGLLGKSALGPSEGLVLEPCDSVHTFFMRFAIYVIFADKNNKVIKMYTALKPNRITSVFFNASYAVELPAGTIQSSRTEAGDTLAIQ